MDHLHAGFAGTAANFIRHYYWAFLAVLVLFLFKKTIVSAVLVVFLLALGIVSALSTRLFNYNAGIELITFVTVVLAFAYGPLTALLASVIMVFGSSVLLGRIVCPITIGRYGTYVVLCVLAAVFGGLEVTTAGKILVVVYNILMWAVYAMVKGFSVLRGSVPVAINLVLNFFLFSTFAQPLVHALR